MHTRTRDGNNLASVRVALGSEHSLTEVASTVTRSLGTHNRTTEGDTLTRIGARKLVLHNFFKRCKTINKTTK